MYLLSVVKVQDTGAPSCGWAGGAQRGVPGGRAERATTLARESATELARGRRAPRSPSGLQPVFGALQAPN